MMRLLADECCPRAVVDRLRSAGYDVLYAAETHHRAADDALLAVAGAENRIVLTEDFDFGDLLVRDKLPSAGAIIVYLPGLSPALRAKRLQSVLDDPAFIAQGQLTIIEARRVRQRPLTPP